MIAKDANSVISLAKLHAWVEGFVADLRRLKAEKGEAFIPWDYKTRYDPATHIARGYINADENVAFASHRDALKCFGYASEAHCQRGWWGIPNTNAGVWFPKFYTNAQWDNGRTPDGQFIYQTALGEKDAQIDGKKAVPDRIVFAHDKDALGYTLYRFLGAFSYDPTASDQRTDRFRLNHTRVDLRAFHGDGAPKSVS